MALRIGPARSFKLLHAGDANYRQLAPDNRCERVNAMGGNTRDVSSHDGPLGGCAKHRIRPAPVTEKRGLALCRTTLRYGWYGLLRDWRHWQSRTRSARARAREKDEYILGIDFRRAVFEIEAVGSIGRTGRSTAAEMGAFVGRIAARGHLRGG